jgi:molecular chaperone GrpE
MSRKRNGHDRELELSDAPAAAEEQAAESPETGLAPSGADEGAAGGEADSLRREVAELQEALLRRRADFENYRKRVERDRAAAAVEAEAALLTQLLGTVDNLERALQAQDTGSALREGVVLTHRELLALLDGLGVKPLDPLGEHFDPTEHQAILHEPASGFEPGQVAEVFRKGFRYRDRLLRPALVKVASDDAGPGAGDVQ